MTDLLHLILIILKLLSIATLLIWNLSSKYWMIASCFIKAHNFIKTIFLHTNMNIKWLNTLITMVELLIQRELQFFGRLKNHNVCVVCSSLQLFYFIPHSISVALIFKNVSCINWVCNTNEVYQAQKMSNNKKKNNHYKHYSNLYHQQFKS